MLFTRSSNEPATPVVVLITSVLSRQHTLLAVLAALARQTRVPSSILLRLDRYTEADERALSKKIRERGIEIEIEVFRDRQTGAGRRWEHPTLRWLEADAVLHTIDDDLVPEPDYIERTTRYVLEQNAVITWHGWANEASFAEAGAYFSEPATWIRCAACGAGVSAYRWRWLKDIESPLDWRPRALVDECLYAGPHADDDALSSLHLWMHGVTILRPPGRAPIVETEESRGPGASFRHHAPYRHGQRLALAFAYDWPGLEQRYPGLIVDAKPIPGSSWEAGFLNTLLALNEPRRAAALRALERTLIELQSPKQSPAYTSVLAEPLFHAKKIGGGLLMLGLGRWTIWAATVALARGMRVEIRTPFPEHTTSLPDDLRRRITITAGDYDAPLEKLYDLVIVAPHQRELALDSRKAMRVIVLPEGREQC